MNGMANGMGRIGQQPMMSMPGGGGMMGNNNVGRMGQTMSSPMSGQMQSGGGMMMSSPQQTMMMGSGPMGNRNQPGMLMSSPQQMGGGGMNNQMPAGMMMSNPGNHNMMRSLQIPMSSPQQTMMMGSGQMGNRNQPGMMMGGGGMSNQMPGMMMGNNNMMRPQQVPMSSPQQTMMMGSGPMGNRMAQPQMMSNSQQVPTTLTSSAPQPLSMGGQFYEANFPANAPLGLTLDDGSLLYSSNTAGGTKKTQVVMIASVQAQNTAIQPGDVIVSINNEPTINLPDSAGDIRKTPRSTALRIITEQQQVPRTLKMMRFRDPSVLKTGTLVRFDSPVVLAQIYDSVGNNDVPSSMLSKQKETPSIATYLAITFPPDQESLGMELDAYRLTYKLEETGQYKTIDCCLVTSSGVSDHVRSGDIVIKINGLALLKQTAKLSTNAMEQELFLAGLANKLKTADRTNGRTLVVLRQVCYHSTLSSHSI